MKKGVRRNHSQRGLVRKWMMQLLCLLIVVSACPIAGPKEYALANPIIPDAQVYGDPYIVDYGDSGYAEGGVWKDSGLKGFNNSGTRYSDAVGSWVEWSQDFRAGYYRVSYYRIVHASMTEGQIDVMHNGVTETVYGSGNSSASGWVVLGDFQFAGNGGEYVRMTNAAGSVAMPVRADAVKFERLIVPGEPDPADDPVIVKINGTRVTLDPQAIVQDGTPMVPAAVVLQAMGAQVTASQHTVTAAFGTLTLALDGGSGSMTRNGQDVPLSKPVQAVNGVLYSPASETIASAGGSAAWNAQSKVLAITSAAAPQPYGQPIIVDYGDNGYSEGGGWLDSGLKGFNNSGTRYSSKAGSWASWTHDFQQGLYRISYYRIVYPNTKDGQLIVSHNGVEEQASLPGNMTASGWVVLGDYTFAGRDDEYVRLLNVNDGTANPVRADAVKFERLVSPWDPDPADDPVIVKIDGTKAALDPQAIVQDGVPMVPAAAVLQAMGADVTVSQQEITAVRGDLTLQLDAADGTLARNGQNVPLSKQVQLINGVVFGPADELVTSLGGTSEWNGEWKVLNIRSVIPVNAYIAPDDFATLGTWETDSTSGAFRDLNLRGMTNERPQEAVPATANAHIPAAGKYYVWARTWDVSPSSNSRLFQIRIGGQELPHLFGKHGGGSWKWEMGGTVELPAGSAELNLLDKSGFYARVDGIFLTNDPAQVPLETYEGMAALVPRDTAYPEQLKFPDWALAQDAPAEQYTIGNGKVSYTFYQVQTPNGTVIQRSSEVRGAAGWIPVERRTDPNAWLLLYAESSKLQGSVSQFPLWSQSYTVDGEPVSVITTDIYRAGLPLWLIPSSMSQVDGDTVELKAENDYASLTIRWHIADDSSDPQVTLAMEPKQNGFFSIGIFAGSEQKMDDVSFVLAPYRIAGKYLPGNLGLVTESYATAPLSLLTVDRSGSKLTYGVSVDPQSIGFEWPRNAASRFALSVNGTDGGARPGLFAPMFGTDAARMKPGDRFEFAYRMVGHAADWSDTYKALVTDLYGFADYRSNYYATLNEAIDNTRQLMLNDEFGGWGENGKAHYNIELPSTVSVADPLEALQAYLLTGDENVYEKRTVPTIEYLLSRGKQHFIPVKGNTGGTMQWNGPMPIGSPVDAFGTAVFGGAYAMTNGLTPTLGDIGIKQGARYKGGVTEFSEYVWMYRFTGEQQYLDKAKQLADAYIASAVDKPKSVLPRDDIFIALSYYPDIGALIDLYETSGDQKYLDAAAKAADLMLTTVFTGPVPAGENYTVSADEVRNSHFMKDKTEPWWAGRTNIRRGYDEAGLQQLQDETVPDWVVSRAGLSLEQTSTFRQHDSAVMIMAAWAPDLMRLSKYTGDRLFETYARNAIVGRHSNYSGYYYDRYLTYQMQENYPYEGPDLTGLYYHHIPPFLAMLEDFLITQAWNWSDGAIIFPYVRQQGYAYFNNRHYGFDKGSFFDLNDMWLWLKEGLVTTTSKQIDYVAARKAGQFAVALMNESKRQEDVMVTLSAEATGGALYSGPGVLYTSAGEQSPITLVNGQVQVAVPAHGLIAIAVQAPGVQDPAQAALSLEDPAGGSIGNTAVQAVYGTDVVRGATIQMKPDSYHAYVNVDRMPDTTAKVTLHYRIGEGEWQTKESASYPYEFTTKVEDAKLSFTWYMDITNKAGAVTTTGENTLMSPLSDRESSNADLRQIAVNNEPVSGFEPGWSLYTVEADHAAASVSVQAYAADARASLTINGVPVASGAGYRVDDLQEGDNKVLITVTAENGKTVKSYYLTIRRADAPEGPGAGSNPDAGFPVGDWPEPAGKQTAHGSVVVIGQPAVSQGSVTAVVDASVLREAIEYAASASADNSRMVTISLPAIADARSVTVTLPVQQVRVAVPSGIRSVKLQMGLASVTVPAALFAESAFENAERADVAVALVDRAALPEAIAEIAGENRVYEFTLRIDGRALTDFRSKMLTISFAYALRQGEDPNRVAAYYLQDERDPEPVRNSIYDPQTGYVTFDVKHFGKYAAFAAKERFRDLSGVPWAAGSIEALAARGIVIGDGQERFAPYELVTRGQFLKMLIGAFEWEDGSTAADFTDISADDPFYVYAASAQKLGIVNGYKDGTFGPARAITRQDMAVMAYRAMSAAGVNVAERGAAAFADEGDIQRYAQEAVQTLRALGIVDGTGANRFTPQLNSTRAQAAKMIFALLLERHKLRDAMQRG
ncbi:S-layer homology domain-containing protein [Paenibacillus sp. GCM10027626]|uniref:S-layer homology domain-containing protein n=1 Tax=Paenibacillus sp. GCM10027626 TaxID=3273411 RepID=UPI00363F208A